MAADAPITLREWLREGPFSLALSQGFCCFPALAGALLAIEEALDVPLRRKVHAVSGSSGGAIVAAFVAAGHSVRSLGPRVSALSPSELMDPFGDSGLLRGGLCAGARTKRALSENLGANDFADLRIDFAASAFRLDRLRLERLDSGDCAAAVVASCAVPGLFAPQRLPSGWYADFAVLLDPCGDFSLPSLPPSGRLLSLVAGDWNPRCWAEATPSRLPGRLGGDAVVVSLRVSGVSRVWPWAIRRLGARAHREAYLAVSAALDRPLGAGREPRHHRVEAVPPAAKASS